MTTLVEKPSDENLGDVFLRCIPTGLAAGAMLAMTSSTMLPEAHHKGGVNIVSVTTVLGFVFSFFMKVGTDILLPHDHAPSVNNTSS